MLEPEYAGRTKSIPWLLMPWLLASPGHQQPWYWLCMISRSLSFIRIDRKYLCHLSVQEWVEIKTKIFMFSENESSMRRVKLHVYCVLTIITIECKTNSRCINLWESLYKFFTSVYTYLCNFYARTVPAPHKGIYVRKKDNAIVRLEVGSFICKKIA